MEKRILKVNNIFKYATSELSQDAFICWLLSYATEEGWNADPQIRECAIVFMNEILQSKGSCWKADTRISGIHKQYKNIDVLVEVGDFKIIIEDKTFTCSHSNQINTYKDCLLREGVKEENIICVFYKIEEQAKPEPNVDFEFTRKILLNIFRNYKSIIQHPIFVDYLEYLEWMDYQVNSWQVLPISQWSGKSYVGLFTHLGETVLANQNYDWRYVANPTGGFMGLWWTYIFDSKEFDAIGFTEDVAEDIYIQFENNIIALKYSIDNPKANFDKEVVRNNRQKIYDYFKNEIGDDFKKKVFRPGTWMTVGYVEYDETNYLEKLMLMKNTLGNLLKTGFKKQ